MEQLLASSIQNFNFAEVLCVLIISRGLSRLEKINDSLKKINDSLKDWEKRIENIEKKIEERFERRR